MHMPADPPASCLPGRTAGTLADTLPTYPSADTAALAAAALPDDAAVADAAGAAHNALAETWLQSAAAAAEECLEAAQPAAAALDALAAAVAEHRLDPAQPASAQLAAALADDTGPLIPELDWSTDLLHQALYVQRGAVAVLM